MTSRFVKKHCPKCGGNIYLDADYYGWYEQCLQCGYIYDMESPSEFIERISTGDKGIPATKEPLVV